MFKWKCLLVVGYLGIDAAVVGFVDHYWYDEDAFAAAYGFFLGQFGLVAVISLACRNWIDSWLTGVGVFLVVLATCMLGYLVAQPNDPWGYPKAAAVILPIGLLPTSLPLLIARYLSSGSSSVNSCEAAVRRISIADCWQGMAIASAAGVCLHSICGILNADTKLFWLYVGHVIIYQILCGTFALCPLLYAVHSRSHPLRRHCAWIVALAALMIAGRMCRGDYTEPFAWSRQTVYIVFAAIFPFSLNPSIVGAVSFATISTGLLLLRAVGLSPRFTSARRATHRDTFAHTRRWVAVAGFCLTAGYLNYHSGNAIQERQVYDDRTLALREQAEFYGGGLIGPMCGNCDPRTLLGARLPGITNESLAKYTTELRSLNPKWARIRTLCVENSYVDDDGLGALNSLTELSNIDLSGSEVTGSGFVHFRGLPLTSLSLRHLDLTQADWNALSSESLYFLDVSYSRVSPDFHKFVKRCEFLELEHKGTRVAKRKIPFR